MGSPSVLDIESLLRPVSDDAPAGTDLRQDYSPSSVYFKLKDVRTAARSAERRAQSYVEGSEELERPDWRPIVQLAPEVLATGAKDLEVCAWLIEALLRENGFAGLRDGLKLAKGLAENFWDGIYPRPDEDGILTTVAPLTGLNGEGSEGTLIAPIAMVPITEGRSFGPFNAWDYDQAKQTSSIDDEERREQRIAAGAITLEEFKTALAETDRGFLADLVEDVASCLEAHASLTAFLDERCGADSPPSSNIRQALQGVQEKISFLTRDLLLEAPSADTPVDEDNQPTDGGAPAPAAAPAVSGAIQSREDAFRAIDKVAEYFRKTEPHSPVSYLLEQAIRWGQLPLPDLMAQLIQDDGSRAMYFQLTGIDNPQD